jgi:hypothetical protein
MNLFSRSLVAVVSAIALFLPNIILASGLNEGAALDILLRTIKHDHVYDKRISLDCVTFDTEETTRIYFEIAVREKHNKKCGGDPDTSPVIDRYRVNRASGKLERYDVSNDAWQRFDPAKMK